MKRFASPLLVATLVVGALAPAAKAETKLGSFNVVSLAFQGRLAESGIPGYGQLVAGVSFGSITVEDVVEAAIATGHLSETTRQDAQFVTAIERHLQRLSNEN